MSGFITVTGNTNASIQTAVDRLAAAGGGTVKIPPGVYIMGDSLHLRSGVSIEGSGSDTVLRKTPCVSSPLIYYLGYGHYDVSVAEPDKFAVGTGVCVTDRDAGGFYNTVATVTGKHGSELILNRMLNHDYRPWRDGRVVSVCPVISGYHLENVSVSNLVIDGNAGENAYLDGCRGGGIFLLQAHNITLRDITVKDYNGDAISFQQCRNILIENCLCIGNTGSGLHPGSGSVGTVMRGIQCRDNGGDGIFYCLRVSYSLCEDCVFEGNGRHGISIGHRDTDAIVRNNRVGANGGHGIYFREDSLNRSGCRTLITGNSIEGGIYFDSAAEDAVIYGNGDARITGSRDEYLDGVINVPAESIESKIGPDNAPRESYYHLG